MNIHIDQLENLRQMAFGIASEMELNTPDLLLQDEVEELGNRLEKVRQSISLLADIAEARSNNETECNRNITDVKYNLNKMKSVSIAIRRNVEKYFFKYR